jgi:tetratricopeptide (TPR) repeat protein
MNKLKTGLKLRLRINILGLALCGAMLWSACQTNPTEVVNPTITDEALRTFPGGSANQVLQGVRNQFSAMIANVALYNAYVSDDYVNISTFLSPIADNPRNINADDISLPASYFSAQTLRAQAEFAISQIPLDRTLNETQRTNAIAQARFFRGMALVVLAENFANIPLTEGGPGLSSSQVMQQAINDFLAALPGSASPSVLPPGADPRLAINQVAPRLALARAYRFLGRADSAVFYANAALNTPGSAGYAYRALYDAQNFTNGLIPFLITRVTRDLQPLPRLDFLDPKYTAVDSPIPVLKIEEAHLILAEAAIAAGDFAQAKTHLKNAIAAALRPDSVIGFFSTNTRPAVPAVGGSRPRSSTFTVKADAESPAIAGLIRTRPGIVNVYPTSFTSLRAADIDALPNTEEELVRTLFLLRQEIFFLEGRRVCDLGIRLPLWRRQLDVNPIGSGPGFDLPIVPAYIPQFGTFNPGTHDMDAFTVSGNVVTISVDMNRVLARNRAYPLRRP